MDLKVGEDDIFGLTMIIIRREGKEMARLRKEAWESDATVRRCGSATET